MTGKSGLRFSPGNHQYRYDGQHIPGVTTLIKGGLPSPALMYWSARSVAEYVADNEDAVAQLRTMGRGPMVAALKETPWQARDAAAFKGTAVHDLAERLVHGEEVDVPEHLAGYVEGYVRFLDEWQPTPVLVEAQVFHPQWWYAGTLDLVADLPERIAAQCPQLGPRPLLDVKSGSGVYPDHAYQLAAYRYAERFIAADGTEQLMADIGITGAAVIHVSDGGYEVVPVEAGERTFKDFLHIAHTAKAAKTNKELIGAPITLSHNEESAA